MWCLASIYAVSATLSYTNLQSHLKACASQWWKPSKEITHSTLWWCPCRGPYQVIWAANNLIHANVSIIVNAWAHKWLLVQGPGKLLSIASRYSNHVSETMQQDSLDRLPDPLWKSWYWVHGLVCPRRDAVLANQIRRLLCDVRHKAVASSKDIVGRPATSLGYTSSKRRARTSRTGKTVRILALRASLAA